MDQVGFSRRCRMFAWLMTVAGLALAVVFAIDLVGWTHRPVTIGDVILWSRYRLAMPVYLVAVMLLARLLFGLAQGDGAAGAVPRTIAWVGALLTLGALTTVFGPSLIVRFATGRAEIATFDASAITLGVAGAGLWLLADVLKRGEAARAELADFL